MAYPQRWLNGRVPERGDQVPVREELVPTDDAGNHIPTPGDAIINLDMNYNNCKQTFNRSSENMLRTGVLVMIGDYDNDPGVHPHDQVPVFKVRFTPKFKLAMRRW